MVLTMQDHVLSQVLSPITLSRMLDSELKTPADQDAFTAAELLRGPDGGRSSARPRSCKAASSPIARRPSAAFAATCSSTISSSWPIWRWATPARRPTARRSPPQNCKAWKRRLKQVLAGKAQLDAYTRAHLDDLSARIRKVLDARINLQRP